MCILVKKKFRYYFKSSEGLNKLNHKTTQGISIIADSELSNFIFLFILLK